MAREILQVTVAIDTASNPDDTTIVAAPGAGRSLRVRWIFLACTTLASGASFTVEDGVGGARMGTLSAASIGGQLFVFDTGESQGRDLPQLTANSLLNVTNEGATGAVGYARVCYEIV